MKLDLRLIFLYISDEGRLMDDNESVYLSVSLKSKNYNFTYV
jgi:hypothetical protein